MLLFSEFFRKIDAPFLFLTCRQLRGSYVYQDRTTALGQEPDAEDAAGG